MPYLDLVHESPSEDTTSPEHNLNHSPAAAHVKPEKYTGSGGSLADDLKITCGTPGRGQSVAEGIGR